MPLAETLRCLDPSVLQPWYADNFALQGPASRVADLFHMLCHHGPSVGNFLEPEKCWVICPPSSKLYASQVFNDASLPISYCHRRRYVGGFIGSHEKREEWLSPMIQKWVMGIKRLATMATRFPHFAYAGLVSCLSAKWQYICWIQDVGPSLAPVENALRTKFLHAILGIDGPIINEFRTFLGNGVKTRGMAIRDPTLAIASLYSTFFEATNMLAGTLIRNKPINVKAHQNCVRATGATHQKTRRDGEIAFHTALMERSQPKVKKQMEHVTAAGVWLSTIPSGTKLTKDEWLDNVAIRYGRHPANLHDQCDGCRAGLTLEHGLSCKRSGLVDICHNDVCVEWAHLCSIALTDSRVVIKPTIFYGNGSRAGTNKASPTISRPPNPAKTLRDEACGDVLAHGFCNCGRGTVFDVRICDTDSRSNGNTSLSKIFEHHEKEKKDKYKAACLNQRRDFTPLVYSINGMISKDTKTAE
ncbi:hypothetical protein ACHAW6_001428 [Cyclotella cf. meneghiniana]